MWKLDNFLFDFIDLLETHQTIFSRSFSFFCVLVNVLQTLSFLIQIENNAFLEPKLAFVANIIYYSNFSNILLASLSESLIILFFTLIQALVYLMIVSLLALTFCKSFYKLKEDSFSVLFLYKRFISIFLNLYLWVFMIPILSFFTSLINNDFGVSFTEKTYTMVFTILFLIFNGILGFVVLWGNRVHSFIEINLLRRGFSIIEMILLLLKVILPTCFYIMKDRTVIMLYFMIIVIEILNCYNGLYDFSLSDCFFRKNVFLIHINALVFSLGFLLKNYTQLLNEKNFIYIFLIASLFATKAADKLLYKAEKVLFNMDLISSKTLSASLATFYRFFQERGFLGVSSFYFQGLLRSHISLCRNTHCSIKEDNFHRISTIEQTVLLNGVVAGAFINHFREKKTRNSNEFETLLLQYGSFVTYHNPNPIHAFLDLKRAFALNRTPSLYFNCIVRSLESSLKGFIVEYEFRSKQAALIESKEIDLMSFYKMIKLQKKLNKSFICILKEKIQFWEKYRDGFPSYDSLFKTIHLMNIKVTQIRTFLKISLISCNNNLTSKLFLLKYLSILSCVLLNHLNEGAKIEDEIEKLKRREPNLHKDLLNPSSFFEDNVLFLQASFLQRDGLLLESSKTEKMGKFFGYSTEETKGIKSVRNLMPEFIGEKHSKFVDFYINKPRNPNSIEKPRLETFGIDKKGFVFPLKLYLGHCFDYPKDFVLQSALIRPINEEQMILFDSEGDVKGISAMFYKALEPELKGTLVKDLNYLNLFPLIPNLREVLTKNQAFENKGLNTVRNQNGFLYLPKNLNEIIDIFRLKTNEEEEIKSYRSYTSSKSHVSAKDKIYKTGGNTSKSAKFLNKLFQTMNIQGDYKGLFQRKYAENMLKNQDILKELMNIEYSTRFKIGFDLLFSSHQVSTTEHFKYGILIIQKMSNNPLKSAFPLDNTINGEQDPTLLIESEIKSGFINMPPLNIPEFREPVESLSEDKSKNNDFSPKINILNENNNRLFTTEPLEINPQTLIIPFNSYLNQKPSLSLNFNDQISLNQEEVHKKLEDSFVSSSLSIKNPENNGKLDGKTSNERIYEAADISSQHSSLSSLKKTFAIFNMMQTIQKSLPNSLYGVLFSRLSEILFIIVFCIYLLILSRQYIYNYYIPLEEGLLNFSNIFNAYALSTSILFQTELLRNNYTTTVTENSHYFSIFRVNMENCYENFHQTLINERKKHNELHYQNYYKTTNINTSSFLSPNFENIAFKDFLDTITELLHEVKGLDMNVLDNLESEYFITNFLPLNNKFEELILVIWGEFDETNASIFNSIQIILILFIILLFLIKFFELYNLEQFYQQMVRIVNIFLRTNPNEALNEVFTSNEIIKQLNGECEKVLSTNYPELLLNRKVTQIIEDVVNSNIKIKTHKSLTKKVISAKRNTMRPLSRISRLTFATGSYIVLFCFLFFNYFYCSLVNDQIVNLINISNFFQNLYTLPSGLIVEKLLIIREKIFINEFAVEVNREQRLKDLSEKLEYNIKDLTQTNQLIPQYTLFAVDEINDIKFKNLINGNICDVLLNKDILSQEENIFCESIYDGVFTKGLLSVSNAFVNGIYSIKNLLNPNSTIPTEELKSLLATDAIAIDVSAIIFINKALILFYDDLEDYYREGMLRAQRNLQIMMILTTISIAGGFLIMIIWYLRYCKRLYQNITLILSMIPYDRLINDEQTVFLIKKFARE